ncbi:MAG: GYD domain-containing protein [Candidatus Altiarchaeum hamiconexum]|nr:GYD domain-containing protein [Candidatus Altarchaeum hamiconexum]
MATYIMLGRYSVEGIKEISKERTKAVADEIKKEGGRADAMYAVLGNYDLCFVVDFPGNTEAIKASVNIAKATGIGFRTLPAIPVDEFDKTVG